MYPTRCNVTQFILSGNCSTRFGWYHHPSSGAHTTISTESGTCHTVTATCHYSGCRLNHCSGNRQPKTYVKPEAAITVFELLMMCGVSPETCWAIKKHWNNKFYYMVASCWFFLWDLKNYICVLVLVTLMMATWVAETCRWLGCNKLRS